ncbi:hypothetical protein F5887DRAFT_938074 [Amanita rubescens]|nr:hypothetical protein F5887DRAFT_938074 [Amanita rubescens]
MTSFHRLYPIVLSLFTLFLPLLVAADLSSKSRALHKSRYTQTHSLGDSYSFDPRDGWQSINVTNAAKNYEKRHNKPQNSDSSQSEKKGPVSGHITGVIESIFKLLKPYGQFQKGVATWYSGEDLKNPSCWSQTSWSPSDESFTCATTQRDWITRPKCLSFIELCSKPNICVYVRVVDSCAGCKPGTSHIDLTRKPFTLLFDNLDVGEGDVLYRPCLDPPTESWFEDIWGPRT